MDAPLTVSKFNERVNLLVSSSELLNDIAVTGEISEYTFYPRSGYHYLTLKDERSSVRCVITRMAASYIKLELKVGMKVTAYGNAAVYIDRGQLQFNIKSIEDSGKGELQKALEELTAKLMAEGLFDVERKRPIPRYPKVIGVVTSAKGAVIKDIIDTTANRYPVDILLSPATVQGEDAPRSLVKAINLLQNEDIDVMIVGRGGGSADDLSAFNDESVVRAIADCKVPVISAVGHATNKSLCDRVADRYAETPTAAAMFATPDRKDENRIINNLWTRVDNALKSVSDRMAARFDSLDRRLSPKNAQAAVNVYQSKFNNASNRMDSLIRMKLMELQKMFQNYDSKLDPKRLAERLSNNSITMDRLSSNMDNSIRRMLDSKKSSLNSISMKMEGLDPKDVLKRGYSLIRDAQGNVITGVDDMFPGTDVTITMRDGSAVAKIKELKKND